MSLEGCRIVHGFPMTFPWRCCWDKSPSVAHRKAKEPQDMMVGARFTYSADHFEAWCPDGSKPESSWIQASSWVDIFQRKVLFCLIPKKAGSNWHSALLSSYFDPPKKLIKNRWESWTGPTAHWGNLVIRWTWWTTEIPSNPWSCILMVISRGSYMSFVHCSATWQCNDNAMPMQSIVGVYGL
jgi:hypothetical protein